MSSDLAKFGWFWPSLVDFGQIWLILAKFGWFWPNLVDFWPNLVDFWPMHNGGAILLRQQDFIFGYVFQPFEQLPNFVFSTKERKKERKKEKNWSIKRDCKGRRGSFLLPVVTHAIVKKIHIFKKYFLSAKSIDRSMDGTSLFLTLKNTPTR